MTQAELNKLCALWQKRLRLQDWRVEVKFVRKYELPDCHGETAQKFRQKIAKIKILDPSDCDPDWADEAEVEETLVHELMHLYYPDASTSEEENIEFETVLNLVAEALVGAYKER